jgi:hypothetical protein
MATRTESPLPTRIIGCATKLPASRQAHVRVQKIGGQREDGQRWSLSNDAAIAAADGGLPFAVRGSAMLDELIEVFVAVHNGQKYLKAKTDLGPDPTSLLQLPDCPAR